jgi:hypothetical protein
MTTIFKDIMVDGSTYLYSATDASNKVRLWSGNVTDNDPSTFAFNTYTNNIPEYK